MPSAAPAPTPAPAPAPPPVRKSWSAPRVTCLEARPEVSAYSGDSGPWPYNR
jgi:hypothetical protein